MIHLITKQPKLHYSENITVHFNVKSSGMFEYFENKKSNLIGLDTETEGFDPHINKLLLLQLGDENTQFVIDCITIDKEEYIKIFEENYIFLIHNAAFDLKFLYKQGIYNIKVYCTYLAEAVLNVGRLTPKGYKGLAVVTKRYCKVTLDKEPRGLIHKLGHLSDVVVQYAAKDVVYLETIWLNQRAKLAENSLLKYFNLETQFVNILAYMMFNGIKLDKDIWTKIYKQDEENLERVTNELNSFILDNEAEFRKFIDYQLDLFSNKYLVKINWSSDKQVLELMKHIGINTTYVKKGETKEGIGVGVLTPQKNKHPLVPIFLEYQKYSKAVSTFGKTYLNYINKSTGRVHTTYNQIQNTTRMSCGDSSEKNAKYPNLQQIPAGERRKAFVAEEDNYLTAIDYDGQEDIIFVNKCLDQNLLDFYDKKLGDGHSYVAKLCFPKELSNMSLENVKKERPDLRQKAKSANFAIKFGGVGFTISNNLSIPAEEGEEIYKAYMDAFPGIKDYFEKVFKESESQGYVLISKVSGAKSYFDFYEEYLNLKKEIKAEGFWNTYRTHKEQQTDYFKQTLSPLVRQYFKYEGTIRRRSYNYPEVMG